MPTTQYYTLLIRHEPDTPWSPEFGDYSKTEVLLEAKVYRESYNIPRDRIRILKTDSRQSSITTAISRLNAELGYFQLKTNP